MVKSYGLGDRGVVRCMAPKAGKKPLGQYLSHIRVDLLCFKKGDGDQARCPLGRSGDPDREGVQRLGVSRNF